MKGGKAEMQPILTETERAVADLMALAGGSCLACLVVGAARRSLADSSIRSRARLLLRRRGLPLLGLTFVMAAPALAAPRPTPQGHRSSRLSPEPPWSGANGSPPPRLLVRTKALPPSNPKRHPAIHGVGGGAYRLREPLFARVGERSGRTRAGERALRSESRRAERDRSMNNHPAGKGIPTPQSDACSGDRYAVRTGDALWSIAADVLATEDPSRIARYWPRIHRANRALIGANPNVIFPGQVLELPPECE